MRIFFIIQKHFMKTLKVQSKEPAINIDYKSDFCNNTAYFSTTVMIYMSAQGHTEIDL